MSWVTALLNAKAPAATPDRPLPGATPRNSRPSRSTRSRAPVPSISEAPVTVRHRIADEDESVEDKAARLAGGRRRQTDPLWPETEGSDAAVPGTGARRPGPSIDARVNHGAVEFRVSGRSSAVTFEELEAACARLLPGVVLQRSTKWLQYTFDMWAHAGTCLYSIPIATMPADDAAAAPATGRELSPGPKRKQRRAAADLAAHHPRG